MRLCAIVCECVCVLCCVVMLFKRLCLLPLSACARVCQVLYGLPPSNEGNITNFNIYMTDGAFLPLSRTLTQRQRDRDRDRPQVCMLTSRLLTLYVCVRACPSVSLPTSLHACLPAEPQFSSCSGVQCAPRSQCHVEGECFSDPFVSYGRSCVGVTSHQT